tara:strand:- start:3477 stop:3860 length:384 start_codon:yes stop_codon:yes gene_type:complete
MKINDIIFKTRVGDYFWVVTSYKGRGTKNPLARKEELEEVDIYHVVAYREIYTGPMGGVGDYEGTRITSDEDIEGRHLEMCAIYKKRLEKGGKWEGQDRPLAEQYPLSKKKIEQAKRDQDALEALEV